MPKKNNKITRPSRMSTLRARQRAMSYSPGGFAGLTRKAAAKVAKSKPVKDVIHDFSEAIKKEEFLIKTKGLRYWRNK